VSELPPEDQPLTGPLRLKVVARLRGFTFVDRFVRALVGAGGCAAQVDYLDEPGDVQLTVWPDALSSRDVAALARSLLERPEELFVGEPVWRDGNRGVLQLILVLAMLERRRNKTEPSLP
jgi:hypothetical protein